MHYIGVDLAWGQNATTGLAVVDESGALLDVTDRRSDEAIISWLEPWVADACLVAIDAPIIVNNPTGNRQCERLIGKHFGRYQAYCHSANTSKRHFAGGTRALRIARALDLDVDPASSGSRRAVEVYPHPAIVALFDLPRILRYKAKPGRDLELLRSELLRLIGLLDGLVHADVPMDAGQNQDWQRIRHTVHEAHRKADLARVEDSIDAVVCAYIAAYATHRHDAVRVMGDLASGYILTPVTPEIGLAFDSVNAGSNRRTSRASEGVACAFCDLLAAGSATWIALEADAVAFAPLASGMLAPGHTLVVARRHCGGVYDAGQRELSATVNLIRRVSRAMMEQLGATGVNALNASGPGSGQSVPHLHFHVVPRWPDDGADMWPSATGSTNSPPTRTTCSHRLCCTEVVALGARCACHISDPAVRLRATVAVRGGLA